MKTETFKFKDGRYYKSIEVTVAACNNGRIYFKYPFCKSFTEEIKVMEGYKYHDFDDDKATGIPMRLFGSSKIWSIPATQRNLFQLEFLFGRNPYEPYERPLVDFTPTRPLYKHQCELAAFGLTRHYCMFAAEMGTGKTLASIEVMEQSGAEDWWYVAPKSALKAVERELRRWDCKIIPRMITYEGLKKLMDDWVEGKKAPQGVIFDESSRVKTPTAQRSQAAKQLADGVRSDWGDKGYVILMSGSPAPKSPVDWWHQCEVACPGFLREGTIQKFQLRLGIFEKKESFSGGVFQQRVSWLDDEKKCGTCGALEDEVCHQPGIAEAAGEAFHPFIPSVNEVAKLYRRMNGLVMVKFKKDCLDLPEKQYRIIECKPTPQILRAAKMIAARAKNTISALTQLRTLSDGFQYKESVDGKEPCRVCKGTRKYINPQVYVEQTEDIDEVDFEIKPPVQGDLGLVCPYCDEKGEQDRIVRTVENYNCPKDEALRDVLEEHDDVGRIVIYAGFSGSVDRCVNLALGEGWAVIRVDGRGWWQCTHERQVLEGDPLTLFQDKREEYPRIAFIGQPGAAGMGLTLTASPSICYYSNDFNAESRIQSEDRIHRPGMDVNRGATIIDLLHLPSDYTVLENLKAKRVLQNMTLGQLQAAMEDPSEERLF